MGKFAIAAVILLFSCTNKYHIRRAAYHLSKLDSTTAESVRTDSTARSVRFHGVKDNFKFQDVPNIPIMLKGKNGVEIRYLHSQAPGVPDTTSLQVDCPDTLVTVYDTKRVEVYRIPASYKDFIKELLGISNFQFWLYHSLLAIVIALVILRKVLP